MTAKTRKLLLRMLALLVAGLCWIGIELILWQRSEALGSAFLWLQLPLALSVGATALLARDEKGDLAPKEDDSPEEIREQLGELATRIEQRERELNERLKTFHEWMEFPQPLDLNQEHENESSADIAEKDKRLQKLLDEESERVFDKILNAQYTVAGELQITQIRDEATDLIRRIAAIYQPDAQDPLLETSVAQILHASSRASLQFITVLEDLPLDVKDYSIQNIYDYVEKGVKAYGVYKKFEPYKPYVDTAYYLGRFAMGASPISLGAWWLVGTLGQKGAEALTTHFLEGQALTFLQNLIRVIGYEVASIYGGDIRHRDPNWFYAVEVVELIQTFPASRRSLACGLKEIGRLSLRSEYDRIFLYRCLAAHQSANAERYDATVLDTAERSQIAERLEQLFLEEIHSTSEETTAAWQVGLQQRLAVQIKLDSRAALQRSAQAASQLAASSLAGFLVDRRGQDAGKAIALLESTQTLKQMDPAAKAQWRLTTEKNPPFYFDIPDLDPDSEVAQRYLADLATLILEIPPYREDSRSLFEYVAHALRSGEEAMKEFDDLLIRRMSRNLSGHQPEGQLNGATAHHLAHTLDAAPLVFVYGGLTFDPADGDNADAVVFATDTSCGILNNSSIIWEADDTTRSSQQTTLGQGHCRLSGGKWKDGKNRLIQIDLPLLSGYVTYFKPLVERFPEA
ncbi:MAG: hypothetical protein ACPGVU_06925 [Limisphaerales bacterium]